MFQTDKHMLLELRLSLVETAMLKGFSGALVSAFVLRLPILKVVKYYM